MCGKEREMSNCKNMFEWKRNMFPVMVRHAGIIFSTTDE